MVGWSTAATRHEGEEHVTLPAVRACGREPAIHEEAEQHAVAPVSAIRSDALSRFSAAPDHPLRRS